ncbi:hypothetical protein [Pseudonocardia humida]|uniref:hypothetical protein n=1 Tax=Pseudonocardia humida TaxID=2800819 RepID=UPI00207D3D5B|nr:hypothetical protein [Pseudonocardia humida]
MTGPADAPAGYTVVACAAVPCRDGTADDLRGALRDSVARSARGVLVVAGCTMGPTGCRLRQPGAVVVVQPCDAERRPVGAAVRIGPVRTAHDVTVVRDWLGAGRLDPAALPGRLTALHGAARD